MRVVTFLPGATEIVAALGGGSALVGISHECDYPESVLHLPRVTATSIDASVAGGAIDTEVRRLRESGRAVIAIEADTLRDLAPDLIITQDLCEVCAVSDGEVQRLTSAIDPAPAVLTLRGRTVAGVLDDIRAVAHALDLDDEGDELTTGLQSRLDRLRAATATGRPPPVLCIEWLDPVYLAGHWVPELVAAAGGAGVGARPGAHSAQVTWEAAVGLRPACIIVMLCGFGVERAQAELEGWRAAPPTARALLRSAPVWILDGNAYTSRPGPRLVDGAERIRAALAGRPHSGLVRWSPA